MVEFDLCDIWRNFHPNLRQYTRHQRIPKVLSRLDFILVSENLVPNCLNSKIFPGIQSDHSIVSLQFNDGQPQKGPGFWKLNCHFLHNDADFVQLIKSKISEFKDIHQNTESNPNVIWDALKCTITGVCMEYGARKKKERKAEKAKLMEEIEKAKIKLNESSSADSSTTHLDNLESELNKILDLETKGLMIRSRTRWMEHGEKSSNYFCNLEKRSGAKKNIYRLNNDDGSSISGDVVSEIHSFFQALYSSQNTGCPRMFYTQKYKILRIFITIKTIEFGVLIYLSDRAVLLAFWRILNQGNRPNKTENTWHYVKRVIFCILIEVGKKVLWAIQPNSWHALLFICGCVLCLFWVKTNLNSYKWLNLHVWDSA